MSKDSPAVSRQIVQTTWHGPLPPPETLEQFKRLVPDAPGRIFCMAEEEACVRREIMKRDSESQNLRKEIELRAPFATMVAAAVCVAPFSTQKPSESQQAH